MKKIHFIYSLVFVALLFFASCEKGLETVEYASTVYLPQSGPSVKTPLLGESVLQLGVYHAGVNQPTKSLAVTLGVDEAAGAAFIALNAGYEMLPSSYYSLPQTQVKLDGERAFLPINMKGIDVNFSGKKYILPISIQSVDKEVTVSEAQKTAILQFTRFRNVFETKYKAYGQVVLSGTADTDKAKIDEVISSTSVDANTIQVKGAAANMNLLLTVQNGQVQVTGAPGSEAFNIANTPGKTSTYSGNFSDQYQCNQGTYMLYYTYTASGKQMDATVELKFWL